MAIEGDFNAIFPSRMPLKSDSNGSLGAEMPME